MRPTLASFRALLLSVGALLLCASCVAPPPAPLPIAFHVPFLPQPPGRCGGLALAMVEQFYGGKPDLDRIDALTRIPVLDGSIPALLVDAARRDGFLADILPLHPATLYPLLEQGFPLILLLAPDPGESDPRGHFIVATGGDPSTGLLRVHTGTRPDLRLAADAWQPRHAAADYLVVWIRPAAP